MMLSTLRSGLIFWSACALLAPQTLAGQATRTTSATNKLQDHLGSLLEKSPFVDLVGLSVVEPATGKSVFQQPLERGVSMRFLLWRTSALLIQRRKELFQLRAH